MTVPSVGPARGSSRPALAVGFVLLVLSLALSLSLPPATRAEEPPPKPPPDPRFQGFKFDPASFPESDSNHFSFAEGELVGHFSGHVSWNFEFRGQKIHLQADRLVIHARSSEKPRNETSAAEKAGKSEKTEKAAKTEKTETKPAEGGVTGLDLKRWHDFTLYGEAVRVEIPARKTFFEAESFYYEHATGRGVGRGVRLETTAESEERLRSILDQDNWQKNLEASDEPPRPRQRKDGKPGIEAFFQTPLCVHAKVLRFTNFESFEGEGIEVSTCDFGVPHFALGAASATVVPVERSSASGESSAASSSVLDDDEVDGDGGPSHEFIIDPEDAWLEALDHRLVPFPVGMWDTRWNTELPIRNLSPGYSGKYGYFGKVDWNLNYFLSLVPTTRFLPIDVIANKSRMGFRTDYFEKRGFGFGPWAEYGNRPRKWKPWQVQQREWNYYGEASYYSIDDEGDEDRSTGAPVPRENRYWGQAWHRQSVPYIGIFELEYSKLSDPAFLGEYFERISKEEKEQETLIYGQRNLLDNLALTGLVQTRTNDFQSQTERLPEGKLFLFEQPVFETGLYSDFNVQGAYLHKLEDDRLGVPPRGFDREDVYNEWAFPVAWLSPYLQARPFGFGRFTHYGELLDENAGADDRTAFGAGVDVSQRWSRVYRFEPGSFAASVLGIPVLKHVLTPQITYMNTFYNDVEPDELVQVDSVDTVSKDESVSFTLRNALFTRGTLAAKPAKVKPLAGNRDVELDKLSTETRRLLDSQISFTLFPHPGRDNFGDTSSLLTLDNTLTVIPGLSLRGYVQLNPNHDFRGERVDASVSYELIPGKLTATVGDRYTRNLSNVVYEFCNWTISDKWNIDAYYARDFETHRDVEYSVTLNRIFHRLVLSLEYSLDVGEDRNMTVFFHFSPVELLRPGRHNIRRDY